MRYYDLVETPKTQRTFLEDGPNRLPSTDDKVSIYFEDIDKDRFDRIFDEEGYPGLISYHMDSVGNRIIPATKKIYKGTKKAVMFEMIPDENGIFLIKKNKVKTIITDLKNTYKITPIKVDRHTYATGVPMLTKYKESLANAELSNSKTVKVGHLKGIAMLKLDSLRKVILAVSNQSISFWETSAELLSKVDNIKTQEELDVLSYDVIEGLYKDLIK